jgi:hypothetical protein
VLGVDRTSPFSLPGLSHHRGRSQQHRAYTLTMERTPSCDHLGTRGWGIASMMGRVTDTGHEMTSAPITFMLGFLAGACFMWLWRWRRDDSPPRRDRVLGPGAATKNQGPTAQSSVEKVRATVPPPGPTGRQEFPCASVAVREKPPSRPIPLKAVVALPPVSRPDSIVTRTAPSQGTALYDSFAVEGERQWTVEEQRQLVSLYAGQDSVREIAMAMQQDQKQVAARLIWLLLDPTGRIDNDDEMPNARKRYSEDDVSRMREAYEAGLPLPVLAQELGRSQLGVGWRMLDHHIALVREGLTFPRD